MVQLRIAPEFFKVSIILCRTIPAVGNHGSELGRGGGSLERCCEALVPVYYRCPIDKEYSYLVSGVPVHLAGGVALYAGVGFAADCGYYKILSESGGGTVSVSTLQAVARTESSASAERT